MCYVLFDLQNNVFLFVGNQKTEHPDQSCEMPGCIGEVWAACGIGNCLMLLCYDHFNDTAQTAHDQYCKGGSRLSENIQKHNDQKLPASLADEAGEIKVSLIA